MLKVEMAIGSLLIFSYELSHFIFSIMNDIN